MFGLSTSKTVTRWSRLTLRMVTGEESSRTPLNSGTRTGEVVKTAGAAAVGLGMQLGWSWAQYFDCFWSMAWIDQGFLEMWSEWLWLRQDDLFFHDCENKTKIYTLQKPEATKFLDWIGKLDNEDLTMNWVDQVLGKWLLNARQVGWL